MLNDESLSTLRLTCKTLEGATFDRFTRTFAISYCCVYYEARRLSLKKFLHGSPRLIRSLKCIDFTTDPLERFRCSQMQIAPNQDFHDIHDAQRQFDIKIAKEDEPYELLKTDQQASTFLIHSVLLDLTELAPHVSVAFDLSNTRFFHEEGIVVHHDILLAIASTSCSITDLSLSRRCLDGIDELMAHLGNRWSSCTSGIHSFAFQSTDFFDEDFAQPFEESKLDFLANILRDADCLLSLSLELNEFRHLDDVWHITKTLLYANDMASLRLLSLQAILVPEKELLNVFECCKTNLSHLTIATVQLVERDKGWAAILESLQTLPKLDSLRLSGLYIEDPSTFANAPYVDLRDVKHGEMITDTHLAMGTRRVVAAGLQQLLSDPLLYTDSTLSSTT